MPQNLNGLDPKLGKILNSYPVRNNVYWRKERGIVVVSYPKNLTRFERGLQRHIGGPENIRRPMDEIGSLIWTLCDGKHSIKDICDIIDTRYREETEPVLEYVHKVLMVFLERNLARLEQEKPEKPLPVRKQRVLKKK